HKPTRPAVRRCHARSVTTRTARETSTSCARPSPPRAARTDPSNSTTSWASTTGASPVPRRPAPACARSATPPRATIVRTAQGSRTSRSRASAVTGTTTDSCREARVASRAGRGGGVGGRAPRPRATAAGAAARSATRSCDVRRTRGVRRLPSRLERELRQIIACSEARRPGAPTRPAGLRGLPRRGTGPHRRWRRQGRKPPDVRRVRAGAPALSAVSPLSRERIGPARVHQWRARARRRGLYRLSRSARRHRTLHGEDGRAASAADARRHLARPGDDGGALLQLPSDRALGVRAPRAPQGAGRRGLMRRLPPAARDVRALAAARPRAGHLLPLPRRGGGSVHLRAHRAHAGRLRELPRAARQREPASAALPAVRPALLSVPCGAPGESRAAELPRLHPLPHRHPRFEHPTVLPGAVMRRCGTRLFVLLVVLGATGALAEEPPSGGEPAATAPAAEAPAPATSLLPYHLNGALSAGDRLVDVDGSRDKYDEDYNLQPGGRVYLFTLDGEARDPDKAPLDRFHLEVDTPGDEPVSRFALDAEDRALWSLRADFIRSKYFYDVPSLFEEPVAGDIRLNDLHQFDLTRTNGVAELRVHPQNLPTIILGYRLYELEGDGTSTVLVPGGGNFVVEAPQRTVTNVGSIGTEFTALGTGFFVEQQFRRVSRTYGLHGPIESVDPGDGFTLASWQSVESNHINIPITRVRVRRPIGDRIELTGGYVFAHASLVDDRTRFRDGTSAIPADSGPSTRIDTGNASLSTQLVDLGANVRLTSIATFHLDYRYDERTQHGDLDALLTPGQQLQTATSDHVRWNRVISDVEVRPLKELAVRAGVQYAHRDAAFSTANQSMTTDFVGAVAEGTWKPVRWLDLFFRYDNVQIDDPWTIPA